MLPPVRNTGSEISLTKFPWGLLDESDLCVTGFAHCPLNSVCLPSENTRPACVGGSPTPGAGARAPVDQAAPAPSPLVCVACADIQAGASPPGPFVALGLAVLICRTQAVEAGLPGWPQAPWRSYPASQQVWKMPPQLPSSSPASLPGDGGPRWLPLELLSELEPLSRFPSRHLGRGPPLFSFPQNKPGGKTKTQTKPIIQMHGSHYRSQATCAQTQPTPGLGRGEGSSVVAHLPFPHAALLSPPLCSFSFPLCKM